MILNAGGSGWGDNSSLTLLWENPNTTVAFEGGTINVDRSKYHVLLIVTRVSTTEGLASTNIVIPEALDDTKQQRINSSVGSETSNRFIVLHSDYIEVGSCSDNTKCIPYRIYGLYPR